MAQRTMARMYDRYEDAEMVVSELHAAGLPHSDVSLVANAQGRGTANSDIASPAGATAPASTGAGAGAALGTAVGGGLGLAAGLGALAIPGVGPVVAAGWLVAMLTGAGVGAAGGGLVGSLTGAGISRDEADIYAEGLREGGSLVTARVDETQAARAEEVMSRHNPVDWQQRRAAYGADWKGFDPDSRTRVYPSAGGNPDAAPPNSDERFAPGIDPGRRP